MNEIFLSDSQLILFVKALKKKKETIIKVFNIDI